MLCTLAAGCTSPAPSLVAAGASSDVVTLGTTTSMQDSGLLDVLLPAFESASGIHVRAVVGGSGEILAKSTRGDVDVLLIHSRAAELAFVASGEGTQRTPVMFNRFVLVGPQADPAGAAVGQTVESAFGRIHANRSSATFVSRGDDSGTDVREKSLWASLSLNASSFPSSWYKQTGTGQAQTLLVADEFGAYALSDEASWANMRGHGQLTHLSVVFHDDSPALTNLYGVTQVNVTRHPNVHAAQAARFAEWVTSPAGQSLISNYRVGGVQVFFPTANDPAG